MEVFLASTQLAPLTINRVTLTKCTRKCRRIIISYYDHHSQLKINVSKYHTGEKKKDKRGNQRCSFEKVEKSIFVNPLTLVSN